MASTSTKGTYHINLLEMRSAVMGLDVVAMRHSELKGCRVVFMLDSQVSIGAFGKGRSSKSGLNFVCRRMAALSFALNIRVVVRYVRSDRNHSDGPSRGRALGYLDPNGQVLHLVEEEGDPDEEDLVEGFDVMSSDPDDIGWPCPSSFFFESGMDYSPPPSRTDGEAEKPGPVTKPTKQHREKKKQKPPKTTVLESAVDDGSDEHLEDLLTKSMLDKHSLLSEV